MVLVTGGTGNIGSRLALRLKRRGASVRVLGMPDPRTAELSREGIEVFVGDVRRIADVERACMDVRTVYHLAALLFSPENPARFREVNAMGTKSLLQVAERCGANHFILVSSISVTYPRLNAYSRSKLEAETMVRQSGIPWTIARPCLVLDGMGGGDEYRAFVHAVQRFPCLRLPESGRALKRPIHVDDLIEALTAIQGNRITHGKTYALGGLDSTTLSDLSGSATGQKFRFFFPIPMTCLRMAASLSEAGSRISGRRISRITHQSLDGLVFEAAPDISEAQTDLVWTPRPLRDFHP